MTKRRNVTHTLNSIIIHVNGKNGMTKVRENRDQTILRHTNTWR